MSTNSERAVVIFHAGSLSQPLDAMEEEFRIGQPRTRLVRRAGGSTQLARLIALRKLSADILASADYRVIEEMLIPSCADWTVWFAANQMVICSTERSKHAGEVDPENWHRILTRPGVIWGHTDPELDPCGYRSLMAMQLAEIHYQEPGLYRRLLASRSQKGIIPTAWELISMLKKGDLDYGWEYLSVAVQHKLNYVALPMEINLGDPSLDSFYQRAKVEVRGSESGTHITKIGGSCTYGVTMIKDGPNPQGAEIFLGYMLDREGGLQILERMGQPSIDPPLVPTTAMKTKLPAALLDRVEVAEQTRGE